LGATTRVCMLNNRRRGQFELLHKLPSCVQVNQIVIGQFFPVELFGAGNPAVLKTVQRSFLVRVFTIAESGATACHNSEPLRKLLFFYAAFIGMYLEKASRYDIIVGGGV